MRRVTVRQSGDTGTIEIRSGEKVLGVVTGLATQADDRMGGSFNHRPAYADYAALFHELERALAAPAAAAEVLARRDALEAAKIEVWHVVHEMRIDTAGSLAIVAGKVTFQPNGAFLMMRTGGL